MIMNDQVKKIPSSEWEVVGKEKTACVNSFHWGFRKVFLGILCEPATLLNRRTALRFETRCQCWVKRRRRCGRSSAVPNRFLGISSLPRQRRRGRHALFFTRPRNTVECYPARPVDDYLRFTVYSVVASSDYSRSTTCNSVRRQRVQSMLSVVVCCRSFINGFFSPTENSFQRRLGARAYCIDSRIAFSILVRRASVSVRLVRLLQFIIAHGTWICRS